jgi:hypothetical protein
MRIDAQLPAVPIMLEGKVVRIRPRLYESTDGACVRAGLDAAYPDVHGFARFQ